MSLEVPDVFDMKNELHILDGGKDFPVVMGGGCYT